MIVLHYLLVVLHYLFWVFVAIMTSFIMSMKYENIREIKTPEEDKRVLMGFWGYLVFVLPSCLVFAYALHDYFERWG